MGYYGFYEYVSVEEKREKAKKSLEKLKRKNPDISPIIIEGRTIASKWWGKAWNKNLESYADFSNRIGRGRSYVRNGAVLDLKIKEGEVLALVQGSGSKPYNVVISIDKLDKTKWEKVTEICNHKIDTMETLLAGKFPKEFDEMFSASKNGLFPSPKEIHFKCSCPDSARMCKHIAAVLYGVGARLDEDPILFFKLRDIDFQELLKKSMEEKMQSMLKNADKKSKRVIEDTDIFDLFGV
ncbi:SWIM zinc finger family protein [Clostridium sp. PL3]|uniref:SWIM zinc finger family protein n=1 Tax=Clostridium thailandense TaxID=2794346 RepID=A0A949U4X0_9CLOT|nr:SWIM zinc finger family protein [Clostridium thailandense]MBV7276553.1 SWIM zinc finger family protein [Clostridium thailandense]